MAAPRLSDWLLSAEFVGSQGSVQHTTLAASFPRPPSSSPAPSRSQFAPPASFSSTRSAARPEPASVITDAAVVHFSVTEGGAVLGAWHHQERPRPVQRDRWLTTRKVAGSKPAAPIDKSRAIGQGLCPLRTPRQGPREASLGGSARPRDEPHREDARVSRESRRARVGSRPARLNPVSSAVAATVAPFSCCPGWSSLGGVEPPPVYRTTRTPAYEALRLDAPRTPSLCKAGNAHSHTGPQPGAGAIPGSDSPLSKRREGRSWGY